MNIHSLSIRSEFGSKLEIGSCIRSLSGVDLSSTLSLQFTKFWKHSLNFIFNFLYIYFTFWPLKILNFLFNFLNLHVNLTIVSKKNFLDPLSLLFFFLFFPWCRNSEAVSSFRDVISNVPPPAKPWPSPVLGCAHR